MSMRKVILMGLTATALTACGQGEKRLLNSDSIPSDIRLMITQINDGPWVYSYLGGDTKNLPIGNNIELNFTASDDIHTLYIPEFGINLEGVPGMISQSWVNVIKPIDITVQCKDHPDETTGITLTFK